MRTRIHRFVKISKLPSRKLLFQWKCRFFSTPSCEKSDAFHKQDQQEIFDSVSWVLLDCGVVELNSREFTTFWARGVGEDTRTRQERGEGWWCQSRPVPNCGRPSKSILRSVSVWTLSRWWVGRPMSFGKLSRSPRAVCITSMF